MFIIIIYVWWWLYVRDVVYYWVIGIWSVFLYVGIYGGIIISEVSVKFMCIGNVIWNGVICKKRLNLWIIVYKKLVVFVLLVK